MSEYTSPAIVARKGKPPTMLHCYCCREVYERGHFTSCTPPSGMKSRDWLELTDRQGCGKCWRHCQCENKLDRAPKGPLAELASRIGKELLDFRRG
jgi:hypothetical protein